MKISKTTPPASGYNAQAVAEFVAQRQRVTQPAAGNDLLMEGPPTPALEEYRKWKAKREQFAYERDLGKWCRIEIMAQCFAVYASHLRTALDILQRQFGPEPFRVMADGITLAHETIQRDVFSGVDISTVRPAGSNGNGSNEAPQTAQEAPGCEGAADGPEADQGQGNARAHGKQPRRRKRDR